MNSKFRFSIAAATAVLGACAVPQAPPAKRAQPLCAATTYPADINIVPWSVDKFAGVYLRGSERLAVRRDEHRLLIEGWTLGTRQLTADTVESWTWHDGCGVRYEFILPPDGPGAWLNVIMPDGSKTDWHR